MNRNDINRMYTEQVTRLLAQGYQIHPYTMGGSQGEIAHADLTNGSEILRVLLDRESSFGGYDRITLTVGRNTSPIGRGWTETLWNNRLEILYQIKLACITDTYFVTPEEAEGMAHKRLDRYVNIGSSRYDWTVDRRELGTAYKLIALRWLKKQPRMKSARLDDIQKMVKETHHDGTFCYRITAKGHKFTLAPRRD